jgi:Mg/Co/Ni transporter MgtE
MSSTSCPPNAAPKSLPRWTTTELADVLEELSEDDQVEILAGLDTERAADVLEAMEPDDAADLLAELSTDQQETLLARMEPDEAAPLRRLLSYPEDTAGGLMTSEPIILGPEASIAEALALVRREQVPTTLATTVFVCRPPLETPTGRYLGIVHIQRLLREPPHSPVGAASTRSTRCCLPRASTRCTGMLATYDLVAAPVVDPEGTSSARSPSTTSSTTSCPRTGARTGATTSDPRGGLGRAR